MVCLWVSFTFLGGPIQQEVKRHVVWIRVVGILICQLNVETQSYTFPFAVVFNVGYPIGRMKKHVGPGLGDTAGPDNSRAEHILALRCFRFARQVLFGFPLFWFPFLFSGIGPFTFMNMLKAFWSRTSTSQSTSDCFRLWSGSVASSSLNDH